MTSRMLEVQVRRNQRAAQHWKDESDAKDAEIERLREALQTYWLPLIEDVSGLWSGEESCPICNGDLEYDADESGVHGATMRHAPDCVVGRARELTENGPLYRFIVAHGKRDDDGTTD